MLSSTTLQSLVLGCTALLSTFGGINAQKLEVVGEWHDCAVSSFASENASVPIGSSNEDPLGIAAKCATFKAPLCYKDICEDKEERNIEIFVKRILAENPDEAKNVWVLQGGPGASSAAMEGILEATFYHMNGTANVYTYDHRGTGRSNRLDCPSSQTTMSGSPLGKKIALSEIPSCARELKTRYGSDLASFSVTSAATDIARLIETLQADSDVFVYGISYGTYLVERLIHLNVKEVKGYILDGIATSSGSSVQFEYFSSWDKDSGEIGSLFFDKCSNVISCAEKFDDKNVTKVIEELYAKMDEDDSSSSSKIGPCVDVWKPLASDEEEKPSFTLRAIMASLFQSESDRNLIPAILYRVMRCEQKDEDVLNLFVVNQVAANEAYSDSEDIQYDSELLYYLIVFSEMWEVPTLSQETLKSQYAGAIMTNGGMFREVPFYCAYTQDDSEQCKKFVPEGAGKDWPRISYKPDKYWNVSAKIPSQASVLIMNGKLDPQTPSKYAQYLYDAIEVNKPEQKKLVWFEDANHGVIWYGTEDFAAKSVRSASDEDPTSILEPSNCGREVFFSYLNNNGNLTALDTSCIAEMTPIDFSISTELSKNNLGTEDAYDGELTSEDARKKAEDEASAKQKELKEAEDSKSKYKTTSIVLGVLLGLAVIVIGFVTYRWRQQKRLKDEEDKLRRKASERAEQEGMFAGTPQATGYAYMEES